MKTTRKGIFEAMAEFKKSIRLLPVQSSDQRISYVFDEMKMLVPNRYYVEISITTYDQVDVFVEAADSRLYYLRTRAFDYTTLKEIVGTLEIFFNEMCRYRRDLIDYGFEPETHRFFNAGRK